MSMSSPRTTAILIGCLILSVGLNIPTLIDQFQKIFADDAPEMMFEAQAQSDESSSFTITFSDSDGETTITQGENPGVFVFKRDGETITRDDNDASVYVFKRGDEGQRHGTQTKKKVIFFKKDGAEVETFNSSSNMIMLKRDGAEIKLDGVESLLESREDLRELLETSRIRVKTLTTQDGGNIVLRGLSSESDDANKGSYSFYVKKKSDNDRP